MGHGSQADFLPEQKRKSFFLAHTHAILDDSFLFEIMLSFQFFKVWNGIYYAETVSHLMNFYADIFLVIKIILIMIYM